MEILLYQCRRVIQGCPFCLEPLSCFSLSLHLCCQHSYNWEILRLGFFLLVWLISMAPILTVRISRMVLNMMVLSLENLIFRGDLLNFSTFDRDIGGSRASADPLALYLERCSLMLVLLVWFLSPFLSLLEERVIGGGWYH